MAEIKEKIEELVNAHLKDENLFLVDVAVAGGRNAKKVTVLIDGDKGLGIDDCAKLSRKLSEELEQMDLFEGNYSLDVSSPGLDEPLKLFRQYKKNIGREVKVITNEGADVKGKLKEVTEDGILLAKSPTKKAPKAVEEFIKFDQIKHTKVLISFK